MSYRPPGMPAMLRTLAAVVAAGTASMFPLVSTAALPAPSHWDVKKSVVYVTVTSNSSSFIEVFDQAGDLKAPIATITDGLSGPVGMYVDQKQNLWVANFGTKYVGYLTEYPRGSSKPIQRIDVPASYGGPLQVYVDKRGEFYVIGCFEQGCDIAKGSSDGKQWTNISDPNVALPTGIVGDGLGDIYVSGFSTVLNGAIVETLRKGQTTWRGIGFPYFAAGGQLAFDFVGRLTIADNTRNVYSYITSLGQLEDAFRCLNCGSIAFDATGTNIWGLGSTEPPSLAEYQFPGGAPEKFVQLPVTGAAALAVSPAFNPPPPESAASALRARAGRAIRRTK